MGEIGFGGLCSLKKHAKILPDQLFACKVQGNLFTSTAYAPHVFSHVVPLPIVHPHDFYKAFTTPFYMGGQPGGDTWGHKLRA